MASKPRAADRRRLVSRALIALTGGVYLTLSLPAFAIGTAAGTTVNNQVDVTFTQGGVPLGPISAADSFSVDELIEVDVTLQSGGPVITNAGATNQALTYLVTNLGNGSETFSLADNPALIGDDFDPSSAGIYLDSNGNGVLDAVDPLYAPGGNDPTLDANTPGADSIVIFVLNDIPAGVLVGQRGDSDLTAASLTLTGPPGTELPGGGDAGTGAIVGSSGGQDTDLGSYLVSDTLVQINKTGTVVDLLGGTVPSLGSTVTYSFDVSVAGAQTAQNIVITDPIPTNTTYVNSSIRLNGAPLTDVGGDDAGDYNVTTAGAITVDLGDLNAASPLQTISFQVTIN